MPTVLLHPPSLSPSTLPRRPRSRASADGDLPPPPPELDPREPPAPTSVPHRTPSRAQIRAPTAQRSARTSPAHSRATSPSPAVGSPLGVIVAAGALARDAGAPASGSGTGSGGSSALRTPSPPVLFMPGVHAHTHSAPHSPSSLIFERDVTLIPPPIDLSHKPSRLGSASPAPHPLPHGAHFDASDGKVPTVLDDAVEALAAVQVSALGPGGEWGTGSGMSASGVLGGDVIEIEGPVSAVHYVPRPSIGSQAASSSGGIGSGERSPVGLGSGSASALSPQPSTPALGSAGAGEDSFGSRLHVPGSGSSNTAAARHASDPPPTLTRPELKARQSSAGPSLPGAFPSAGTGPGSGTGGAIKEWKRKIKDWVGPKPGPGVFPDEVEEGEGEAEIEAGAARGRTGGAGQAGEVDLTDENPQREQARSKSISPSGAGQLLSPPAAAGMQSQPMSPTASSQARPDKRRISFVSYNDLLQSVPTTISPLSEIANGHIEPDHLPGTVSPVRAASPFATAGASPSPRSPGDHARALGMKRGSEPNLSSFGSRVEDHARGRMGQGEDAAAGTLYERDRSTSTFQREGLGKGLTERLEMLKAEGE